jgi:hypothetical protein
MVHLVMLRFDDSMENTVQVLLRPQKASTTLKNPVGDGR